jgi:hypothetical protein
MLALSMGSFSCGGIVTYDGMKISLANTLHLIRPAYCQPGDMSVLWSKNMTSPTLLHEMIHKGL